MKSNHLLAGLAVVLLGGALWLAIAFLGADGAEAPGEDLRPAPAGTESVAPADLQHSAVAESPAAARAARTAVSPRAGIENAAGDPDSGGVIGRVVEEDRTPVVGISVALLQVDANLMLATDWIALGEPAPRLVLERTVTDEEGRFRLQGARDASFQGLGIDLRGPRSTLRVVDAQLHHGELTDVGDIVLRGGCTVLGRVVDGDGQPLSGARVRIVPVPPGVDVSRLLSLGPQDFRADCSVGITTLALDTETSPVVELPAIVRDHLDDLPLPTTFTDADGAYRIEGVPVGELLQGIDKPHWLGVSRLVTTTPGEVTLEDAVLSVGRTIHGVVVEEAGDPLEGIEVIAGSEFAFGEAAILHPAGRTDSEGRFSLRGLPETGSAMACARRSPDEPWVGIVDSPERELEIELPLAIALTVHVVDTEGEAVRGAKVGLSPTADEASPMGMVGRFLGLGAPPRTPRLVETENGTYVCPQLTPGRYEVTARPPGLAMTRERFELWEEETEVTLVCETGRTIDVAVIDAATREGIPGARASVVGAGFPFLSALAVGRTGKDGHVRLGPFSPRTAEDGLFGMGFPVEGLQVLVQHPRYADDSVPLDEGASEMRIELVRGGEIHGRITWGPDPPQSIYMVVLRNTDGVEGILKAFLPPRIGHSDLNGAFRFTNLPAGTYELEVFDRFFDGDPVLLLMGRKEPTMVHYVEGVKLAPAGRADVAIDLSPSGRGQTARIAGSVHLDFAPVVGAKVRVRGRGPRVSAETDARGEFETPDFLALDDVFVQVTGDVETPEGEVRNVTLHYESLSPEPQRVHRLDLDLRTRPLRVRVRDTAGTALAGARVRLRSERGWGAAQNARTDGSGQATLTLLGTSARIVEADHEGYAERSLHIDPGGPDFTGEVEIELRGAITCAGLVDLTAFEGGTTAMGAFVWFTGPGVGGSTQLPAEDLADDRLASFRIDGLQSGTYEAHLWFGGREAAPLTVELPEGGDENMILAFRPADG